MFFLKTGLPDGKSEYSFVYSDRSALGREWARTGIFYCAHRPEAVQMIRSKFFSAEHYVVKLFGKWF